MPLESPQDHLPLQKHPVCSQNWRESNRISYFSAVCMGWCTESCVKTAAVSVLQLKTLSQRCSVFEALYLEKSSEKLCVGISSIKIRNKKWASELLPNFSADSRKFGVTLSQILVREKFIIMIIQIVLKFSRTKIWLKVTPNFRELPSYCMKSQTICHRSHIQNSIPNQLSKVEIQTDQFFIDQPE